MANFLNFISCDSSLEESEIVLIGCPYDGTSSYRPGSRFAPNTIREASEGLEVYSPYLNFNLTDKKICDDGNISIPFGDKQIVLDNIKTDIASYLNQKKKVLTLGGEHLITYPIIQEYFKHYPELIIIQFDAHTDLRESYLDEKESHATVMKRLCDFIKYDHIYQFGIRSGTEEEFQFGYQKGNFYPFNLNKMNDVVNNIPSNTPIYITLDLDVLDPSIFPGTGTPEPGGVTFHELHDAICSLKGMNIVGADVVELSPDYDPSKVSNIVAAKLVREILLLM